MARKKKEKPAAAPDAASPSVGDSPTAETATTAKRRLKLRLPSPARVAALAPKLLLPAAGLLVLSLLLLFFTIRHIASPASVPVGVRVAGTDLGGYTAENLPDVLVQLVTDPAPDDLLILETEGWQTQSTFEALALAVDRDELLRRVLAAGQEGGMLNRFLARMRYRKTPLDIDIPVTFLPERVDDLIRAAYKQLHVPATGARLVLSEREAVLYSGADGETVDTGLLAARMLTVLESRSTGRVRIPRTPLQSPLLDPVALRNAIRVEPRNATEETDADGNVVRIPSRPGRDIAEDTLLKEIQWIESRTDRRAVRRVLPILLTEPEITEANHQVQGMSVAILFETGLPQAAPETSVNAFHSLGTTEDQRGSRHGPLAELPLAGSFTTRVPMDTETELHRATNITLAAQAMDGLWIAPDAVFSFNGATGPRTAAAGYVEAPIYANGQVAQDIGGGICQVSTTLCNAMLEAGLEPLERHSHMFTVSYAAPGRDAAVSYGYQDLRFRNPYNIPVRLRVRFAGGNLTAEVFLAEEVAHPKVSLYTRVLSPADAGTEKDQSVSPRIDLLLADPDFGLHGAVVETWRQMYSGGNLIAEERLFESRYAPYPLKGEV